MIGKGRLTESGSRGEADRRRVAGEPAPAAARCGRIGVSRGVSMQKMQFTAVALLLALGCAAAQEAASAAAPPGDAQIAALEQRVQDLEDMRAVKHLQRAYGFYADRGLWQEVADLFAPDGTLEVGADGVYVGRHRIRQYLQRVGGAQRGLPWGRLQDHYQLQPVVHVAPDGPSARGRWLDFALLGDFGKSATWGHGIQENEYVRRDGVWMIKSLHLYTTYLAPFEKGWARVKPGTDLRSDAAKAFAPDRLANRDLPVVPGKIRGAVPLWRSRPGPLRPPQRPRHCGSAACQVPEPRAAAAGPRRSGEPAGHVRLLHGPGPVG